MVKLTLKMNFSQTISTHCLTLHLLVQLFKEEIGQFLRCAHSWSLSHSNRCLNTFGKQPKVLKFREKDKKFSILLQKFTMESISVLRGTVVESVSKRLRLVVQSITRAFGSKDKNKDKVARFGLNIKLQI